MNYEVRLCYYKDDISLNDRQVREIREHVALDIMVCVSKKHVFTCFQSVYGCLSVYRHNVSPHFHNRCLFQLSLATFKLPFYKNMCQFFVTRLYMETYSNIKTLRFLEKLLQLCEVWEVYNQVQVCSYNVSYMSDMNWVYLCVW